MKSKKCITIITILFVFNLFALSAQYKLNVYNAYISNNLKEWKATIDEMESQHKKNDEFLLELINYQYGYIGFCIENNEKEDIKTYLKLTENNLDNLNKTSLYPSYADAYKAAIYGFTIALNKLKTPFVGTKSLSAAKSSMEKNPDNPFGYIQYANAQYYMPSLFGGSKDDAIQYYKLAKEIMEKDKSQIKNDWNYLNLLTNMAKAYTNIKDYEKAEEYYKHILEIEPNFLLVKDTLYPNLITEMNNKK